MDDITLGDKKYIKASKAASILGYTPDYVGQLCRRGKIDATMIGKTWYVRDGALQEHKSAAIRSNSAFVKRDLKKQIASMEQGTESSYPDVSSEDTPHWRKLLNTPIQYTPEEQELIPNVAKDVSDSPTPLIEEEIIQPERNDAQEPHEVHSVSIKLTKQDTINTTVVPENVDFRRQNTRIQQKTQKNAVKREFDDTPAQRISATGVYAKSFVAVALFVLVLANILLESQWVYSRATSAIAFETEYGLPSLASVGESVRFFIK